MSEDGRDTTPANPLGENYQDGAASRAWIEESKKQYYIQATRYLRDVYMEFLEGVILCRNYSTR